jgi:hypothetical protein
MICSDADGALGSVVQVQAETCASGSLGIVVLRDSRLSEQYNRYLKAAYLDVTVAIQDIIPHHLLQLKQGR